MVALAHYTECSQPLIINVWLCRDGRVRVGSAAAAKAASGRGSAVCACLGEVGNVVKPQGHASVGVGRPGTPSGVSN